MHTHLALIVDDEPDIRELLEITLGRMGISTVAVADITSAQHALKKHAFDLCLTDMKLPDGNGIALVQHIQANFPQLPVAIITAFGSMDLAITALKAGAFDFISKPVDLESLRTIVHSALNLERNIRKGSSSILLLGKSAPMQHLREQIQKLSRSQAPVYIHGESGSGKELVARSIHAQSGRSTAPFVAVNCGAIPKELMESEFFGHKKGSFTGAIADKSGLFQAAHGGTLFLDEVADLPLDMQVKLLRAIQEKSIRPVGSDKEVAVDVRILSASNKNLQVEVSAGRFRQDLYFRINVIQVNVPSLRERLEDIPLLCGHFLEIFNKDRAHPVHLETAALEALKQYTFPGNVRELENLLERASTLCEQDQILLDDLHLTTPMATPLSIDVQNASVHQGEASTTTSIRKSTAPEVFTPRPIHPVFSNIDQYINDIERATLEQALEESRWNKTAAAKRLGITFRQLRYKLKKLGLE